MTQHHLGKIELAQVAEIIVVGARADAAASRAPYDYGSGYRISENLVITARHVITGAPAGAYVKVRFGYSSKSQEILEAQVAWVAQAPEVDLAILRIIWRDAPTPFVQPIFGHIESEPARVVPFEAAGFPSTHTIARSERTIRDGKYLTGSIRTPTNPKAGYLELNPDGGSIAHGEAWRGFSGAPVFVFGSLAGVVVEAGNQDTTLRCIRVAAVLGEHVSSIGDFRESTPSIADLHGLLAGDKLHRGLIPARRRPIYADYIDDIATATPSFRDREAEILSLQRFIRSDQFYQWWIAGPWTGKTTLAAHLATHPPNDTDIVSFFVSRVRSQQTRQYFESVCDQLSALLGRDAPPSSGPAEFISLWNEAGRLAEKLQRHLVLLVDGLDENDDPTPIAAHLPSVPLPRCHVVVFSREGPPLSERVPLSHPLRALSASGDIAILSPSPYAERLRDLAHQEIRDLLLTSDETFVQQLLGLLAAASPLTLGEILTLLELDAGDERRIGPPMSPISIERIITSKAGRVLRPVMTAAGMAYAFAHAELQQVTIDNLGQRTINHYVNLVHAWADEYERRGWPIDTPVYLINFYPTLLTAHRDIERLSRLATESRLELLKQRTGHDGFGVQELNYAFELMVERSDTDIEKACTLAIQRQRLIDRTAQYPPSVVIASAVLQQWPRALHFTRTMHGALEKLHTLRGLFEVASRQGKDRDFIQSLYNDVYKTFSLPDDMEEVDDYWLGLAEISAEAGYVDRALSSARKIGNRREQLILLYALVGEFAKSNEQTAAEEAFAQAMRLDQGSDQGVARADALVALASMYSRAGDRLRCLDVLKQSIILALGFEDHLRDWALNGIARRALDCQAPEVAVDAATKINNGNARMEVLHLLNRTKHFDHALRLARTFKDAASHVKALCDVALSLLQAGQVERGVEHFRTAEARCRKVKNAKDRAVLLASVGAVAAEGGEEELSERLHYESLSIADTETNRSRRKESYTLIAREFALSGLYDLAEKTANKLGESQDLVTLLCFVAKCAYEDGRNLIGQRLIQRSLGVARELQGEYLYQFRDSPDIAADIAKLNIVKTCVLAGSMQEAEPILEEISHVGIKGNAYQLLAFVAERLGESARAERFATEADDLWLDLDSAYGLSLSDLTDDTWWTYPTLDGLLDFNHEISVLASSIAEGGDPWEADPEYLYHVNRMFARIANEYGKARAFELAREALGQIDDWFWSSAVDELFIIMAKAGEFIKALRLLRDVRTAFDLEDKAEGLAVLAWASAENKLPKAAHAILERAESSVLESFGRTSRGPIFSDEGSGWIDSNEVLAIFEECYMSGPRRVVVARPLHSDPQRYAELTEQAEWLSSTLLGEGALDAALMRIAILAADLGELDAAEEIASQIVDSEILGNVLIDIAYAAASQQDDERIERISSWVKEFDDRPHAIVRLIARVAEGFRFELAESLISSIEAADIQACGLACIGLVKSRVGQLDESVELFRRGELLAESLASTSRPRLIRLLVLGARFIGEDVARAILVRALAQGLSMTYIDCAFELDSSIALSLGEKFGEGLSWISVDPSAA
ncbi:trypsin-like peptidase domain-containing protein [Microbispora sp. H13382]|uniref:trypsin-like peptidase domain-containing protein n=1 Tax=Microbispora sp. H13382 TaxID=2729112 RepID=UPI0015FEBB93|nr:trypsin-like peptidase domain-containing protein [Microbispora sp. H13382]